MIIELDLGNYTIKSQFDSFDTGECSELRTSGFVDTLTNMEDWCIFLPHGSHLIDYIHYLPECNFVDYTTDAAFSVQ